MALLSWLCFRGVAFVALLGRVLGAEAVMKKHNLTTGIILNAFNSSKAFGPMCT